MAGTVTRDGTRVHRTLKVAQPAIEGPDVKALQQALNTRLRARGLSAIGADGEYGPITHQAALDIAWFLGIGPASPFNRPLSPFKQKLIRDPDKRNPVQRERAVKRRHLPAPGGVVRPLASNPGPTSEFEFVEKQGAPGNDGRRHHGAKDWFAPGFSPVKAPVSGKIIETRPSLIDVGQVFGGTVKIHAADNKVWVFRHVIPQVSVGQQVRAGKVVAKVTNWKSGPPHAHIEVWKTPNGGRQDFENMIDPMTFFRRFV